MTNKILIIEDEEKIARFIELELLHEGYEVEKCGDGRTGLELAEGGNFSLVLLDIMLPELNGLEVLRRLRRSSKMQSICLVPQMMIRRLQREMPSSKDWRPRSTS